MKPMPILYLLTLMVPFIATATQAAGEAEAKQPIKGKVVEVNGDSIRVTRDLSFDPSPGDPAEVYFPVVGLDEGAVVATGRVSALGDRFFLVQVERASGKVAQGYYVRVFSKSPRARPSGLREKGVPAGLSIREPLKVRQWITVRRTAFKGDEVGPISGVRLSADGSRVAFAGFKGTYLMNADGSNRLQLGDRPNRFGLLDLSVDGGKVAWYDDGGLHFASNDGTGRPALAQGYSIDAFRLTLKGDRIFALSRGRGAIYSVPVDGSAIKQLAGTTDVAKLEGSEPNIDRWGRSLDISEDGSRLVFDYRGDVYTIDGTDLRRLTEFGKTKDFSLSVVRLSGDGKWVAMFHTGPNRPANTGTGGSLTVRGWGGAKTATYTSPEFPYFYTIRMTRDGSVVMSNGLRLFTTDGKSQEELAALPGLQFLGLGGAGPVTPSADGKRFCLILGSNPHQLIVVDRSPASRGKVPPLEDITLSPQHLTTDGSTEVAVSARITTANVQYVGALLMRDGLSLGAEPIQLTENAAADLADTKDGRVLAGKLRLPAGLKISAGPLTLRLTAIDKSANALVIDVDGLEARKP